MKINFKPLEDRIVIVEDTPEQVSAGGILIPAEAQQRELTGTVVAIGDGLLSEHALTYLPMYVAVGDRVLYTKYAGGTVKILGKDYQVMRQNAVIAIIDADTTELVDEETKVA